MHHQTGLSFAQIINRFAVIKKVRPDEKNNYIFLTYPNLFTDLL